jgi:hypothetical protein
MSRTVSMTIRPVGSILLVGARLLASAVFVGTGAHNQSDVVSRFGRGE